MNREYPTSLIVSDSLIGFQIKTGWLMGANLFERRKWMMNLVGQNLGAHEFV